MWMFPQGVSEGDFVDVVDIAEEEVEEISEVVNNVQSQAVQIRSDLLKESAENVIESAKSPDEISVVSSPKRKRSAAEALVPLQKPLAAPRPLEPSRTLEPSRPVVDTSGTLEQVVPQEPSKHVEPSSPLVPLEPSGPVEPLETPSPLVPLDPPGPPATKKFRLSLRPGSEGVEHLDFDSFFLEQFLLSPVSVAIEQCSAVIRAEGPAPDFEEVCDQIDEENSIY